MTQELFRREVLDARRADWLDNHRERMVRVGRRPTLSGTTRDPSGTQQAREPLYRVSVAFFRQSVITFGRREALKPGI